METRLPVTGIEPIISLLWIGFDPAPSGGLTIPYGRGPVCTTHGAAVLSGGFRRGRLFASLLLLPREIEGVIDLAGCSRGLLSLLHRGGALTWLIGIMDRRWRWSGGALNGQWNVRDRNGLIRAGTEAAPQALAALCFAALGERAVRPRQPL